MKPLASLFACVVLSLLSLGCPAGDEGGQAGQSPPPRAGVTEALTDGGSWRVSYQAQPATIPLNQLFRVLVTVEGSKKGSALPSDLEVSANAGMPGHGHGMNTVPRTKSLGSGRYEVEGFLFHMPGAWQLTVDVMQAGQSETAVFDVNLQ